MIRSVVLVDLGKSRCRAEVRSADGARSTTTGIGSPGLAAADGVRLAVAAIEPLLPAAASMIVVGAAGALGHPDAGMALARRLAADTGAELAVTSDVVTAHAGAFDGGSGTLLIAGTGSVAYRLDQLGDVRRAGGWGPWLGDEGSGQWIGRLGLSAVLAAADGRGGPTALTGRAVALAAIDDLPRWVGADPAERSARFAPAVLELAEGGDPASVSIVEAAIHELHRIVAAVSAPTDDHPVLISGGLADSPYFLRRLVLELATRAITLARSQGTALDGAALLADRRDLPHERHVHRA